jgi:hypothetical protein
MAEANNEEANYHKISFELEQDVPGLSETWDSR